MSDKPLIINTPPDSPLLRCLREHPNTTPSPYPWWEEDFATFATVVYSGYERDKNGKLLYIEILKTENRKP